MTRPSDRRSATLKCRRREPRGTRRPALGGAEPVGAEKRETKALRFTTRPAVGPRGVDRSSSELNPGRRTAGQTGDVGGEEPSRRRSEKEERTTAGRAVLPDRRARCRAHLDGQSAGAGARAAANAPTARRERRARPQNRRPAREPPARKIAGVGAWGRGERRPNTRMHGGRRLQEIYEHGRSPGCPSRASRPNVRDVRNAKRKRPHEACTSRGP